MANKKPIKMQLPTKKAENIAAAAKGHTIIGTTQKAGTTMGIGYGKGDTVSVPLTRAAQAIGGGASVTMTQPMFFSPLHTPQNWQIASKRREVYQWARFYYENEPKVAAGIDFYSQFPINGFKLECKKKKITAFYERLVDRLELVRWLRHISHERFLLGDVFVFLEIDSPDTRGETDLDPDETPTHADGTFKRIMVLNPDWIEVYTTPLADEPEIVMLPDDELKKIVMTRQPESVYKRLPNNIKQLVAAGRPIRLSNNVTSHIKHGGSPYGTYGDSLLRRLFTILAYKTKLMTANWIVAERLILPVRVVKVGEKDRPAAEDDIADVVQQLSAVANDPNLTIVTHHAFDYEWYGACHSADTEILTPEGWKFFYELSPDAIVATYNTDCGQMQWQQIDEYHEYDFRSTDTLKMYNFKARGVDISVTPNHRMLIERNGQLCEVYSQEVKHGDKFLSTVDWAGRIPKNLPYKNGPLAHMVLDDYLELVGYYLSEGGVKKERNKNLAVEKQIQACSVGQNRSSPIYDSMKEVVGLAYPNFSEQEDDRYNDTYCYMTINSVDIARYLAEEFGDCSSTKKIPRWIRDLPKNKLQIVYDAMMAGDGDVRNDHVKPRYRYSTTSKDLADGFSEIALKLGYFTSTSLNKSKNDRCKDVYRIYWSEWKKETPFEVRKQHISREDYEGKVYCVKVPNTWIITRRNGRITVQGNTGKIHNITNELEQIGKEMLDGLMLNQALLNGEMSGYQNAQVGVEMLIRRLESWRKELAQWVEKNIFLPVAKMQGFIDEEESDMLGETVYLYPRIKWDDLKLRDPTNRMQMAMNLHQNGTISTQTLLELFELDYDQEVERLREEQVQTMGNGQIMGGQPGAGGLPGGGMPGGGGGMPPGGDPMGGMGGAPMGGDPMGGGMGGAPMGGAPMGGGMPAAAQAAPQKVTKRGKGGDKKEEEMPPVQVQSVQLTKPEAKVYRILSNMQLPFQLYAQYKYQVPGEQQPYLLDFALPDLGLNIEADGEQWHSTPEDKNSDQNRDYKLAEQGWTVIRVSETALNENVEGVENLLAENIKAALDQRRKMQSKSANAKIANYRFGRAETGLPRCSLIKTYPQYEND